MKFSQPIILVIFFDKNAVAISPGLSPVTSPGRLLEVLEHSTLARLDRVTSHLVSTAAREAAENTLPLFDLNQGWPSTITTPQGILTLNMTSRSDHLGFVTFAAADMHPNILVRFSHDCVFGDSSATAHKTVPHPALQEYWFGYLARKAGVGASTYYYVSPPVAFPTGESHQMFPGLTLLQVEQCRAVNAAVRFVVFTRPRGDNLRSLLERFGRIEPVFALKIGGALMQTVKTLHNFNYMSGATDIGITHGNMRLDDVYVEVVDDTVSVKLRGFSSSRVSWMDRKTGSSLIPELPRSSFEMLQSPWELVEGHSHRYNVRDDLYRAVQLTSILLNGVGLEQDLFQKAIEGSLAQHKFHNPVMMPCQGATDPFCSLPLSTESKSVWISALSSVNARVFGMDAGSYDDISRAFDLMIARAAIDFEAARTGFVSDVRSLHLVAGGSRATRSEEERVATSASPDLSYDALTALASLASSAVQEVRRPGGSPASAQGGSQHLQDRGRVTSSIAKETKSTRRVSFPSTAPEVRTYIPDGSISRSVPSRSSGRAKPSIGVHGVGTPIPLNDD